MKNKAIIFISILLLYGCCEKKSEKELISKTDHCSYYRIWVNNGVTSRSIYACECDPGYECKVQIP